MVRVRVEDSPNRAHASLTAWLLLGFGIWLASGLSIGSLLIYGLGLG